MSERELLMIPGPTNVDPAVLRALSKTTTSHTSPEFVRIFRETLDNLKKVFMTNNEVFVISGSGTLALEMAVANIVEPGDKILNTVSGFFGNCFVEISKVHGAVPEVLEVPWGKSIKPELVRNALEADDYKAVTVTHVETSTGVANPIREIGEVVKKHSDAFYIVDTVCSLGGMEVRVDDWHIDACASGSQKCIGVPPGLALLSVSNAVLSLMETRKTPARFWYGGLGNWLPVMRDPSKYFATPPVNMVYAISEALKLILNEGLEKGFNRHHILAEAFRAAVDALNLKLVADRESAADTVTAAYYPDNIEDGAFRSKVKQNGIVVASTLGPLKGKGFRVGHMGNVNLNDIMSTVGAIETTLRYLGYGFDYGAGLKAAQEKVIC
ncbi:MAG: alanine--glyoxylate aminotransferase family protein [Candidatus Bathyarchaeota archaeon]|nr:alanine--glyoxylate aminotransferase family protein [Candidatus Bathyarchaeota archaeon]MDH5787791.1 alanine--glyoxylate aminotransferase family protein [Candidatus Bathyarchaeota archaeon]